MNIFKPKFDENPYKVKRSARVLNPLHLKKQFRIEDLENLDKSLLWLPEDPLLYTQESKVILP
jgi:hypothetical protein